MKLKHLFPLLVLSAVAALGTGCATQGVPSTKFNITDPVTGVKLSYEGPKQVAIESLETTYSKPGGVVASVKVKGLSATNEPSVVQTAGDADAKRIQATAGLVKEVGATVGTLAGVAAGAAAKTAAPVP